MNFDSVMGWRHEEPTLEEIEEALDQGRLEMRLYKWESGYPQFDKFGKVRRNGKTQQWKTRPSEFRIPVKYGLYVYDAVTEKNLDQFRIGGGK